MAHNNPEESPETSKMKAQISLEPTEVKNIDDCYTPKVVVGSEMPAFTKNDLLDLDPQCKNVKQILILYTGGTIGMRKKDGAYEPEPNYLTKALRKLPMFNDTRIRQEIPILNDMFIMPRSNEDVRVIFNVWEYNPLIDSSDMTMDDYLRISKDIEKEYDKYDSFIILHGTDTMSFTGSALSFLFENLTKPIILTGSQIPIFELRSDGRENLLASLMIASHFSIPEVTIFFHQKLYRANRSSKYSSVHFDAFESPNYPPLADLGINMQVYEHRILPRPKNKVLKPLINRLCPDVTVLRMFPSITCATVQAILAPPVKGVVLQTYGSGNMPYCRKDLLSIFKEAYDRGVIIVNITQCWKGGVKAIYRTGFVLREYGIMPGMDMTLEAALTKLSYVLSCENWNTESKRSAMARSLRGEMTFVAPGKKFIRTLSQDGIFIDPDVIIVAAICSAAKEGDIAQLDQLGQRRGNLDAMDYDGRTALHIAATENRIETVRFLIEKNAKLNIQDRFGQTPLLCAVLNNSNPQIIKLMASHGAVLNMTTEKLFEKLSEAIRENNNELLESFYYAGVNYSDKKMIDSNGNTLTHIAAMYGRTEVVKRLGELKLLDISSSNNSGNTAAEEALIRDYRMIHDILLSSSSESNSSSAPTSPIW